MAHPDEDRLVGVRVGLAAVEPAIDFAQVMDRVHRAIATIEPHDSPARLHAQGVEVAHGEGRFLDPATLEVDGRRLRFTSAIVACGSQPALPPLRTSASRIFAAGDVTARLPFTHVAADQPARRSPAATTRRSDPRHHRRDAQG